MCVNVLKRLYVDVCRCVRCDCLQVCACEMCVDVCLSMGSFAGGSCSEGLCVCAVLQVGDAVSVFSDVENKCTRGAKSFQGQRVFLGNGVCEMSRSDVFCSKGPTR